LINCCKASTVIACIASGAVGLATHAAHAGNTAVNFLGPYDSHFDIGWVPTSVASADIDGDGLPDLVVVDQLGTGAAGLAVLVNTTQPGAMVPTFAATQFFDKPSASIFVTAADLNDDGKPDLALAVQNGVSVMLNTSDLGQVSFAPEQTFAAGTISGTYVIAVADINGDGKPDLMVMNYRDDAFAILLNTMQSGDTVPSFSDEQVFSGGNGTQWWLAAADFNGDGMIDIVLSNPQDNTITILLNTTPPGTSVVSFAQPASFATGNLPFVIAIADINADGRPDVAVTNQEDQDSISVLLNNTAQGSMTPTFLDQQQFHVGFNPYQIVAADFTGDGRPDLAVTNVLDATLSVLVNTTTQGSTLAAFADQQVFAPNGTVETLVATDINQDDKLDLAFVNLSTASVYVNVTGVVAAPTLSKAFTPASVEVNIPSTVTLTLGNANATMDTLTSNLTDTLPAGLVVAATPNAATTCVGGSVTANAGSNSFALLSGAEIPSGSCIVTVDVEAAGAGTYVNHIAPDKLQTDAGPNTSPADATLTVSIPLIGPTLSKAFAPASVPVDTPSTVTLTLGNTNASADTLTADLIDTLPAGLVLAAAPNAATTCTNGMVTASAGSSVFALTSGAQIPSGSCTVTVDVESDSAGDYVNTIAADALQTDAGSNAAQATATLTVTPAVIGDRVFCDGFDGVACSATRVNRAATRQTVNGPARPFGMRNG